ncbi:uncharacterized protein LOC141759862 [Sebastes fasciatus]|uniref:uncharacterized protein LOC141759862 n=1 Tax=Sebastes fasciatus TaxID=394691 RepID=UPI003D9DFB4B
MMLHCLLKMALDVGLLVLQFMMQLMLTSRPVFQSCICLERYLAVVHPTVFLRFRPLRYRLACCAVDWLLVLLYCTIPIFTLSDRQSVYLLIFQSFFFLALMLSCGVHVLCVLRRPAPGEGDRESRGDAKRRAFKVVLITLVFTSSTQLLRAAVLGPMLLYGSAPVVLKGLLVSLAVDIGGGFVTPLMYLHRAGKLPCFKF